MDLNVALNLIANPQQSYITLLEQGASEDDIRDVFDLARQTIELHERQERAIAEMENAEALAEQQLPTWLREFTDVAPERGSPHDSWQSWVYTVLAVFLFVLGVSLPRDKEVRIIVLVSAGLSGAVGVMKSDDADCYADRVAPALAAQERLREVAVESQLAELIGSTPVEPQEALPANHLDSTPVEPMQPRELTAEGLSLFPANTPQPPSQPPSPSQQLPDYGFGYNPTAQQPPSQPKPLSGDDTPDIVTAWLDSGVKPTMIAGGQGSGKAATAIAIATALSHRDGGVEVVSYDNSEGGSGDAHSIWTKTGVPSTADPYEILDFLVALCDNLKTRPQRNDRQSYDQHPWLVVIIDELSTCANAYDIDEQKLFMSCVRTLMTQGAKRKVVLFLLNQSFAVGNGSGTFNKGDRSNFTLIALNQQVGAVVSGNALGVKVDQGEGFASWTQQNRGRYLASLITDFGAGLTAIPCRHFTHHGVQISTTGEQAKPSKLAEPPVLSPPPVWLPTGIAGHYNFFYNSGSPEVFGEPVGGREPEPEAVDAEPVRPEFREVRYLAIQALREGSTKEDVKASWSNLTEDQQNKLWDYLNIDLSRLG